MRLARHSSWPGLSLSKWEHLPEDVKFALTSNGLVEARFEVRNVTSKFGPGKVVVPPGTLQRFESSDSFARSGASDLDQVGGGRRIASLLRWHQGRPVWSAALLARAQSLLSEGVSLSPKTYPHAVEDIMAAIGSFGDRTQKLPLVFAVFSSITPWIEFNLLRAYPHANLTTVDYNPPIIEPSRLFNISTLKPSQLAARCSSASFSLIVSFSGVEHDGLGRYGDPTHPDGDMAAMEEMRLCLKDSGLLLLGIPTLSPDILEFPGGRIYGPIRLPRLLRGFKLVE